MREPGVGVLADVHLEMLPGSLRIADLLALSADGKEPLEDPDLR